MTSISYLPFLLALLCHVNEAGKHVVIIGKAENAKEGAAVISSDDEQVYYIGGLDSWNERFVRKKVKVEGKLLIEKRSVNNKKEVRQEIAGIKRTISNPTWHLLE